MTDQTVETVTQQQETVTKQKNPLRIDQGKRLVEYNRCKKEELKRLNEQITKQDGIEHKPRTDTNNYVYVGGLSLFGLAIGGYLLYSKFKKPEQNVTLLAPGFFGWCSTGGGCFPPLHKSFVFEVRLLKVCTELLWDKMNILR